MFHHGDEWIVQIVMKELLNAGLIHGDALTVTGRTVAENLKDTPTLTDLPPQVQFILNFF